MSRSKKTGSTKGKGKPSGLALFNALRASLKAKNQWGGLEWYRKTKVDLALPDADKYKPSKWRGAARKKSGKFKKKPRKKLDLRTKPERSMRRWVAYVSYRKKDNRGKGSDLWSEVVLEAPANATEHELTERLRKFFWSGDGGRFRSIRDSEESQFGKNTLMQMRKVFSHTRYLKRFERDDAE